MAITLFENFRALFYTPFYAAEALGAYRSEGLELRLIPSPRPNLALQALLDGEVDAVWGGPLRILLSHDGDPACDLVGFGEVVTRDPFMLVGRRPNPGFRFAELKALRFAKVSEVPTPWICLQDDLRRAGLDPRSLALMPERGMAENAAALCAGELDLIQTFEPFTTELERSGAGHLWYAQANRGPTSYTTFYTRRPALAAKREEFKRMVRAIYRTQRWIAAESPERIAAAVAGFFPDLAPSVLAGAIARYQRLGLWGRDPLLPRDGFERLKGAMRGAGAIRGDTPYEACVDNSLAREVIAEDPPPLTA